MEQPINALNDFHPLNEAGKILIKHPSLAERKDEDGIHWIKSQWDGKWYPEKFSDYLRLHKIVKFQTTLISLNYFKHIKIRIIKDLGIWVFLT